MWIYPLNADNIHGTWIFPLNADNIHGIWTFPRNADSIHEIHIYPQNVDNPPKRKISTERGHFHEMRRFPQYYL